MNPPPASLVVFLAVALAPVQSGAPGGASSQGPVSAPTPSTQTWTDPGLHLVFTYPADLKPMNPKILPGAAQNAVYADDPDAEPDNLLTGRCSRVLLSVGAKNSVAQGGAWGSILITEIDPSCIPPKALKSRRTMDNLLKPMVTAGTQILGLAPVVSATTYSLGDHRVHFAEAEGQPVVKGDLQPAGPQQTIAVLAVQVSDRIVSWKIESNDPALFNRMLASHVDFGNGQALPLFPLQMPGNADD
jgi:hypothetical protein